MVMVERKIAGIVFTSPATRSHYHLTVNGSSQGGEQPGVLTNSIRRAGSHMLVTIPGLGTPKLSSHKQNDLFDAPLGTLPEPRGSPATRIGKMHDQQTSVSNLPDNKPASGQLNSAFAGIDVLRTNMTTRVRNRRYVLLSFFMNKLLCCSSLSRPCTNDGEDLPISALL